MNAAAEAPIAPNGLAATFTSEDAALAALAKLSASDVGDARLFSPLPPPEPPKRTRLPALALVIGLLGAAAVFGLQSFANIVSYPLNIGGRPPFSWPSFIPIAFEAGILSVVLATVAGAGARCGFLRYYNSADEIRALREAMIDRWVIVVHAPNSEALARSREILQRCGACGIEEAEL